MAGDTENLALEHLRHLRAGQGRIIERLDSLTQRVNSLEFGMAQLHADFANQSLRIDRIESRLERIEKRLELAPAS